MKESTSTSRSDRIEWMTKLLQAQTQMLAAQAQAVTVQTLPPLILFNGEENHKEGKTFDRWIERFARLGKWNGNKKNLCQLTAHLKKTAQKVFEVMAVDEKAT